MTILTTDELDAKARKREYGRKAYQKNKEVIKARSAARYAANCEQIKAEVKARYHANIDVKRAKMRAHYHRKVGKTKFVFDFATCSPQFKK